MQARTSFRVAVRFFAGALALIVAAGARADVVVPSSAFSSGRNNAEFHSDVRVFNPTDAAISFTPIFYRSDAAGNVTNLVQMPIQTVGPREQVAFDNVLSTLFQQPLGAFGPILFQTTGALIVSSGVNNVNACGNGSISGQGLPGIDTSTALKTGTLVQLAASTDPTGGYRTNVDFMNPGVTAANVTVKIHKGDGTQLASATIVVGSNGLVQKALDDPATFAGVAGTTDTNLWLEFTSDQSILVFASVINNGSGDPFAIVMTPDPTNPSGSAPQASYSFSANPTTGQDVVFTDASANTPLNRFWVFGDGTYNATGSNVVLHVYGAAGTYHTALFVDNAYGSSATLKDVVVTNPAPQVVAITLTGSSHGMSKWDWQPSPVTLHVGQPYALTFRADPSENLTHGLQGLELLGITQCDLIPPQIPCTINFTPTVTMFGTWTYSCNQTQCAPTMALHNGMTGVFQITE
jgi:PKD repeat protein